MRLRISLTELEGASESRRRVLVAPQPGQSLAEEEARLSVAIVKPQRIL
jgi:hypothetical protein